MEIIIKTRNIKPTESLNDFIEEKIGGLKKFINIFQKPQIEKKPLGQFFVEIEKETKHHQTGPYFRAEVQVHLPGKTLRAEARSSDLKMSIAKIKDEMQQEIKKYKLKKIDLERKKARNIKKALRLTL